MFDQCLYAIEHPDPAAGGSPLCFAYSCCKRDDGKHWAHYPECNRAVCPYLHPELITDQKAHLEGVTC